MPQLLLANFASNPGEVYYYEIYLINLNEKK